ncbi:MAG TPA: signal peptide peptidase SppA [Candidatus Polarisedimenticolaceae bacterium]|nr:signal peptide peptidase SppA [Candidatus Polarisedimenticolaceae bacterium]
MLGPAPPGGGASEGALKKLLVGGLALIGGLTLLAFLAVGLIGFVMAVAEPGVKRHTILQVDFERGVVETVPQDAFAQLMLEDQLEVLDVVAALDRAAEDNRVEALVARIGGGGIGLAHLQEIRDAVLRFRESGKPAIAFSETFGEFGPGNGGYYLATAFDRIYLQPSGDIGLTGLHYESMFVKGVLDNLDVEAQMDQRYEFKNAMNMYTERDLTEAHRLAMAALTESQFEQMVEGIAEARGIDAPEVRRIFDEGPYLGAETVEVGLVDELRYEDEVYAELEQQLDGRTNRLFLDAYLERAGGPHRRGRTVALIHAYGAVSRGQGGYSPLDGSVTMGSNAVVDALRTAITSDRVEAIILRVDSPGGSYVGSDTIWRETVRAREAGKPVIVSMGNLAASGGYFVAVDADRIVAQPGTITGSIGVLGGKLVTTGLWNKLGVTFDGVGSSANSTMFSPVHPFTEHGYRRFESWLDRVYEDFTGKVARGRELPLEEVLEVAKGRVWTGSDALEIGLVDRLGGLHEAMQLAREELGLAADAPLRLRRIPADKTPLELLLGEKPDHRNAVAAAAVAGIVRDLQPVVRLAREAVSSRRAGIEMPPELAVRP